MRRIRIITLLVFSFFAFQTYAQLMCPLPIGKRSKYKAGINHTNVFANKFNITAGAGLNDLYGDLPRKAYDFSYYLRAEYQFVYGLTFGIEGQLGQFEVPSYYNDPRYLENDYRSIGAQINIYPGRLLTGKAKSDYDIGTILANSFYFGAGISSLQNNYTKVYRNVNNLLSYGPIETDNEGEIIYDNIGQDGNGNPILSPRWKTKTNSIILPSINVGLAVPILKSANTSKNHLCFVLNTQFNFSNDDTLDGYMPYGPNGERVGRKNDAYNFYSAGLRYSF